MSMGSKNYFFVQFVFFAQFTLFVLFLSSCDSNTKPKATPRPIKGKLIFSGEEVKGESSLKDKGSNQVESKEVSKGENNLDQSGSKAKADHSFEVDDFLKKVKESKEKLNVGDEEENSIFSGSVKFPKGRYKRLTFNRLARFEYGKISFGSVKESESISNKKQEIPPEILSLDGQKIMLEGYMLPLDFNEGQTSHFLLLPFLPECCFGTLPSLNQFVSVRMRKGRSTKVLSSSSLCRVYGILKVKEKVEEGNFITLYRMLAKKIKSVGIKEIIVPK